MSEALARVLAYSIADIGLNRVEAFCLVDNQAAARVLEKVGMVQEGVLRDYVFQKGAFWNFSVYSVLRRDCKM
jgi:ribosomal-protein-alanine N-acetyltransferase